MKRQESPPIREVKVALKQVLAVGKLLRQAEQRLTSLRTEGIRAGTITQNPRSGLS